VADPIVTKTDFGTGQEYRTCLGGVALRTFESAGSVDSSGAMAFAPTVIAAADVRTLTLPGAGVMHYGMRFLVRYQDGDNEKSVEHMERELKGFGEKDRSRLHEDAFWQHRFREGEESLHDVWDRQVHQLSEAILRAIAGGLCGARLDVFVKDEVKRGAEAMMGAVKGQLKQLLRAQSTLTLTPWE
jgi:hypothetical protein